MPSILIVRTVVYRVIDPVDSMALPLSSHGRDRIQPGMKQGLKSWPTPWQGELLLACRKCQKKLGKHSELARLKKTLKRRNKAHPDRALHVLQVPCMKLCPKDAVTICRPARFPNVVSILRSAADLDALTPDSPAQIPGPVALDL